MSARLDAALSVGAQLANVAFNWSQKPGYVLTSDDVCMLDTLRRKWDEARAALAEAEAQPLAWTMAEQFLQVVAGIWTEHPDFGIRQTLDALNAQFPAEAQPVPLTDEQIDAIPFDGFTHPSVRPWSEAECLRHFARAVERAHGIGGKP